MANKGINGRTVIAAYCRVSSEEQQRDGKSLDVQAGLLERYARERWGTYEMRVIKDVGSGRRRQRAGYRELMELVRRGEVNVVMAVELSRLWRNLADAIEDVRRIKAAGCEFVLWRQGIDTSTAFGAMAFAMMGALAQFESDTTSERTRRAFAQLKAEGRKGPGRRPYGWRVEGEGVLVRDEEEQERISHVLAKRFAGWSWQQVCSHLNAREWRTATGRPWTATGLRLVMTAAVERRESARGSVSAGLK